MRLLLRFCLLRLRRLRLFLLVLLLLLRLRRYLLRLRSRFLLLLILLNFLFLLRRRRCDPLRRRYFRTLRPLHRFLGLLLSGIRLFLLQIATGVRVRSIFL